MHWALGFALRRQQIVRYRRRPAQSSFAPVSSPAFDNRATVLKFEPNS